MDVEVYCQLAKRLDAIPNGFPKTASGVELRLLAKIFTREEASLAAAMHMRQEPASEIAARAGAETERAYKVLKDMARKGLVRIKKGKGELGFGLMPFVVGFYEEQLPPGCRACPARGAVPGRDARLDKRARSFCPPGHTGRRSCAFPPGSFRSRASFCPAGGSQVLGCTGLHLPGAARPGWEGLRFAAGSMPDLRSHRERFRQ
jgi:hypothetical protein